MKTPMPDVDALVEALRGDLPSADDEARVRARLLAAGVVLTSAVLTSASAEAALAAASGAGSTAGGIGGSAVGGGGVTTLAGGAGAAVAGGAATSAGGAIAGSAAGAGTVAGTIAAAAPAAAKAGLLAKLLVLPLGAKVGVASVAVAVAATSVPLVLQQMKHDVPQQQAPGAGAPQGAVARVTPGLASTAHAGAAPELGPRAPQVVSSGDAAAAAVPASTPAVSAGRAAPGLGAGPSPGAPASDVSAAVRRQSRSRGNDAERGHGPRARGVPPRPASAYRVAHEAPPAAATAPVLASTLAEEASLMERAMLALGEGNHGAAGRYLDEHARRFPDGLLAPDRERARERVRALASHQNAALRADPQTPREGVDTDPAATMRGSTSDDRTR